MTTHHVTQPLAPSTPDLPPRAVGRGRRSLLVVSGLLACAVPAVFTANITRMLLTGVEPDHRFHQLTGQGEILFALWLLPILALLRAGWHGRRPSPAAGWAHLVLALAGEPVPSRRRAAGPRS